KPDAKLPAEPKSQGPEAQWETGRPRPGPVPAIGGDAYFQKVWADLHDDDYFTRKTAVERLATMQPNDQRAKVAPKLVELTQDESPFIRCPAVKALGAWGSKNDVPALLRALAHKDPSTRREALKVIGRLPDPQTLEPVIQGFRDSSTRKEAGDVLREMGPKAEPAVLAIVNEPDDVGNVFLKRDAIDLLADIGTGKSVPALEKIAASSNIHYTAHLAGPARKPLDAIARRKKP